MGLHLYENAGKIISISLRIERLYLKACEDLIKDIISMDRKKYRRLLPVYVADMVELESSAPTIWQHMLEGNFSIQKSDIPFTAISADHADEQQNKLLKIGGGIIGITTNENARLRFFLNSASSW